MTLEIGFFIYVVICFAAQLTICLLTKKQALRAIPLGVTCTLTFVMFVLGGALGSMPSNSLLGWLKYVAFELFELSLMTIGTAWTVYGLLHLFVSRLSKKPKGEGGEDA